MGKFGRDLMTSYEKLISILKNADSANVPEPAFLNSWEICLSMRELKVRGARENCVWHAGNLKTKINHS